MSKIGTIIQTRMGSTRLPGKVMKIIEGKTVLAHVIERVKLSEMLDKIIIATTTRSRDDVIEDEALKNGVLVSRGSENDVLGRYYHAAVENDLDVIVRITSDCPLIDPNIVDNLIGWYIEYEGDVVGTAGIWKSTYPAGLDLSVVSFKKLEEAYFRATKEYQREHVMPYIYENSKKISIIKNPVDYSNQRWTIDTEEDLELIEAIYFRLYKGKHDFFLKEIIDLMNREPELYKINAHIVQKER